jgi:uncharacterized membrane protein
VAAFPRNWRTWALVASLGLNLAFVGLLAGAWTKGPPPPPFPGIGQYARELPEPYRRALGHALRESRHDWSGPREALRGRRDVLAAALTAEPFDPGAVAAVLEEDRRLSGDLWSRGSRLLLDQIARMTPAERAAFAAELTEERRGRDGRRH